MSPQKPGRPRTLHAPRNVHLALEPEHIRTAERAGDSVAAGVRFALDFLEAHWRIAQEWKENEE